MNKDTISRQDAIDTIRKCSVKEVTPSYMLIDKAEAMTELMLLPSAESNLMTMTIGIDEKRLNEIVEEVGRRLAAETEDAEPRKGKWTKIHWKAFECSVCGRISEYYTNFCPNCGAQMEEEECPN